jgi:hypothetical protein
MAGNPSGQFGIQTAVPGHAVLEGVHDAPARGIVGFPLNMFAPSLIAGTWMCLPSPAAMLRFPDGGIGQGGKRDFERFFPSFWFGIACRRVGFFMPSLTLFPLGGHL